MKNQKLKTLFSTVLVLVLSVSLSFAPGSLSANNTTVETTMEAEESAVWGKWVPVYVLGVYSHHVCVIFGNQCRVFVWPFPIGI